MELFFSNIDYWHWLILGGVLLIIEVIAPSFFFLWLSIAAAITGSWLGIPIVDFLGPVDSQYHRSASLPAFQEITHRPAHPEPAW